jgi:drug/metabolite transporter (DMT)-like permease
MTWNVFALVLFSAACHAGWNTVARKVRGHIPTVWLGLVLACILLIPFAFLSIRSMPIGEVLAVKPLLYILGTGIAHAAYFYFLTRSYAAGGISLVYPLSRGSGVGLTALFAWMLLNEDITWIGALGIVAILAGILMLGKINERANSKAVIFSLATGGTIVAYSLVDKVGANLVPPPFYIWGMMVLTVIILAPFLLWTWKRDTPPEKRSHFRYSVIIGPGAVATYLMILFAYRLAPVSYIAAFREVATVFGAAMGYLLFREPFTVRKGLGVCLIAAGAVFIKLA